MVKTPYLDEAINRVANVIQLRGKYLTYTPSRKVRQDLAARMIRAYESYLDELRGR